MNFALLNINTFVITFCLFEAFFSSGANASIPQLTKVTAEVRDDTIIVQWVEDINISPLDADVQFHIVRVEIGTSVEKGEYSYAAVAKSPFVLTTFGLKPPSAYLFRVTARNKKGETSKPQESNKIVYRPPVQAVDVQAVVESTKVVITWDQPFDKHSYAGAPTKFYVLQIEITPEKKTSTRYLRPTTMPSNKLPISLLNSPNKYIYQVFSQNAAGSNKSEVSNPIEWRSPPAPTLVQTTLVVSVIHISWQQPHDSYSYAGPAAEFYIQSVNEKTQKVEDLYFTKPIRGTTISFQVDALKAYGTYSFRVLAANAAGNGSQSQPSNAITWAPKEDISLLMTLDILAKFQGWVTMDGERVEMKTANSTFTDPSGKVSNALCKEISDQFVQSGINIASRCFEVTYARVDGYALAEVVFYLENEYVIQSGHYKGFEEFGDTINMAYTKKKNVSGSILTPTQNWLVPIPLKHEYPGGDILLIVDGYLTDPKGQDVIWSSDFQSPTPDFKLQYTVKICNQIHEALINGDSDFRKLVGSCSHLEFSQANHIVKFHVILFYEHQNVVSSDLYINEHHFNVKVRKAMKEGFDDVQNAVIDGTYCYVVVQRFQLEDLNNDIKVQFEGWLTSKGIKEIWSDMYTDVDATQSKEICAELFNILNSSITDYKMIDEVCPSPTFSQKDNSVWVSIGITYNAVSLLASKSYINFHRFKMIVEDAVYKAHVTGKMNKLNILLTEFTELKIETTINLGYITATFSGWIVVKGEEQIWNSTLTDSLSPYAVQLSEAACTDIWDRITTVKRTMSNLEEKCQTTHFQKKDDHVWLNVQIKFPIQKLIMANVLKDHKDFEELLLRTQVEGQKRGAITAFKVIEVKVVYSDDEPTPQPEETTPQPEEPTPQPEEPTPQPEEPVPKPNVNPEEPKSGANKLINYPSFWNLLVLLFTTRHILRM